MKQTANVGDKVKVNGIVYTIANIAYADHFDRDGWMIEFVDTNGRYHYWKQQFDGGEFIPANNNEINNEKENANMNTTFTYEGITYRVNLETNRYSKTVNGKTKRIGQKEFESAKNAKMAETEAKMHEALERLNREQNEKNEFVEITEEDLRRDAEELERYVAEIEESNTDEAIEQVLDEMAEDEGVTVEQFVDSLQKVEKQKKTRKTKKAKNKNAAFRTWIDENGNMVGEGNGKMLELTAKQVDFIHHLPDTYFWENGLDSCIWIDCLCDDIKGQFAGKPMTVGAMVSTLCEKGLGARAKNRVNGKKCTSFELTELGKLVAAALGLS